MSCFAYWDIIPNSCLLLAQSPQEKASFPYSTLRVPRIFSAEGKTKIKMTMSTTTLCFKESISLILDLGCELWYHAPTNLFPSLFPLVFLCWRSTGLSWDPAGSGGWRGALCPGFPSVPQFPSWSPLWVSPLPGPTLSNIDPQTFQVDPKSLLDMEVAQTPQELSRAFQGDAPRTGRNKSQGSQRFLPPSLCCSFPWLLCSAPPTNPKIYLLTRDPSDSIQSSLIKNSHYYD